MLYSGIEIGAAANRFLIGTVCFRSESDQYCYYKLTLRQRSPLAAILCLSAYLGRDNRRLIVHFDL